MAIKKQFSVCLDNKPGQLARLCQMLVKGKVNILAISVNENADCCDVRFVPDSAARAHTVLRKAKLCVRVRDVVAVNLTNEPGALGGASAALAKAGVNIDYVYGSTHASCSEAVCIFAVNKTTKAATVLK